MEKSNELKKIPYAMTKAQLVKLCYPVADATVRNRINVIIFDNRKNLPEYRDCNKDAIIRTHLVERKEILEYFQTYGTPNGFEL